MILSRMITQVKEQHWLAFFIDFVIVVFGVFLGLQVNNWNIARHDRTLEHTYLRSIASELDGSIASINFSIQVTRRRMAYDRLLIKSVTDPAAARSNPGKFIYAITHGGFRYWPTIQNYTFEEIKSAGNLGIIRDRKLVRNLLKFYAYAQNLTQWRNVMALEHLEYVKHMAGILTEREVVLSTSRSVPTDDVVDAMGAYKRMLARPAFTNWVSLTLLSRYSSLQIKMFWLQEAKKLRAEILAEPGIRSPKSETKVSMGAQPTGSKTPPMGI